jgi:aminoglycoside phosphotransferase (APT) family kinase protein
VIAADAHAGALLLTEVTGRTADQIRPTDRAAFAETMATFLTRLHTAPVVEAALVTEMDPRSAAQWLVDTATAWAAVADRTPVTLRDRVDEFLVGPAPNDVRRITFCHNDLGDEHVVLSEDGGHVRGVIDWSDAVLGDPARDLGLLTLDFGPGIVDALIDDYHGPTGADFRGRVLWFAATAGVEGLAWRLANARPWQVTADRLRDVLAVLA